MQGTSSGGQLPNLRTVKKSATSASSRTRRGPRNWRLPCFATLLVPSFGSFISAGERQTSTQQRRTFGRGSADGAVLAGHWQHSQSVNVSPRTSRRYLIGIQEGALLQRRDGFTASHRCSEICVQVMGEIRSELSCEEL